MEIARSGHLHFEPGETVGNIDDGLDFEWAVRGFCLCVEVRGVVEVAKLERGGEFHSENTQGVHNVASVMLGNNNFCDPR